MIGQMAIAIAFPGFNDLGRSVTPIFLLMDHFLSCRFSTFGEKNEENLLTRSLIFCKMYHRIRVEFFAKCTIEFRSFN